MNVKDRKLKDVVKVGDVFVDSWGYDQTNVDAYQVVRMTPTMVYAGRIGTKIVNGRRLPLRDSFLGDSLIRRKVTFYNPWGADQTSVWFNTSSFSAAYLWDGEETYYETYAAGGAGH